MCVASPDSYKIESILRVARPDRLGLFTMLSLPVIPGSQYNSKHQSCIAHVWGRPSEQPTFQDKARDTRHSLLTCGEPYAIHKYQRAWNQPHDARRSRLFFSFVRYDKYSARELFRTMGCSERLYTDAFEPMLLVGLFAPGEQCSAAG